MSVHAFRVHFEVPSNRGQQNQIEKGVGQWRTSHIERLTEQSVELQLLSRHDIPEHYRTTVRFDPSTDRQTIIDGIVSHLSSVGWFIIRYHDCHHDESDAAANCDADDIYVRGSPPQSLFDRVTRTGAPVTEI